MRLTVSTTEGPEDQSISELQKEMVQSNYLLRRLRITIYSKVVNYEKARKDGALQKFKRIDPL